MIAKKQILLAAIAFIPLCGTALASAPELDQSEFIAASPVIILPPDVDLSKGMISQVGNVKVGLNEDDDLMAHLPNPRPDEGPYTAVIQNEDQSSIHTASVRSLLACRGLAKAVLASQISYEVEAHKSDKDDEMDIWGRVISSAAPTEVVCVPSYGNPVTYTAFGLAREIEK